MTAVDHAELKRVADDVRALCNGHPHAKIAWPHRSLNDIADRIETASSALLSEIEGLKAERDDEDALIEVARILEDHVDYDDEGSENMVGLARRVSALSAAEAIAQYLRTQAADSWRPDREAVEDPFNVTEAESDQIVKDAIDGFRSDLAALRPQTAESGK